MSCSPYSQTAIFHSRSQLSSTPSRRAAWARFNASSVVIVAAWRLNSGVYWHALWSSVGFLVTEDYTVLPPSTFRGEDHRMGAADNDDERGPAMAEHPLHGHTIPVGSSNPLLSDPLSLFWEWNGNLRRKAALGI